MYLPRLLKVTALFLAAVMICFAASGKDKLSDLLEDLRSATNDSASAERYIDVYQYYHYSNPDSARYYLDKGLKDFTAKNYTYGIALMTHELGVMDAEHGNLELAAKRQDDAMDLYTRLGNKTGICRTLNEQGVLDGRRGNYDRATAKFIQALKIAEELKSNSEIAQTYTNLGMVNTLTNNLPVALGYFNKAAAILKDNTDIRALCNIYIDIGTIYGKEGDFTKAQSYFENARSKSDTNEYVDVYIYTLLNLGIVYENLKDDTKAISMLDEALQLARENNLPSEQMQLLINKASAIGDKDPKKAIDLLTEALAIGKKLGNKSLLDDAYYNLVQFEKLLGNYKDAANLLQEEMNIKDSLYSVEKAHDIANLQSVYEVEQSHNRIQQLELGMKQQQLKRNILAIVACAFFAGLLGIAFYLRTTRRLYRVVSKQKEELAASNIIKDKLFSIIGHDLRGPLGNVTSLLDIMEYENDPTEIKEVAGLLKEQTQTTMYTLDSLLLWGKSQLKRQVIEHVAFPPRMLIEQNIRLLSITAAKKNIRLVNETADVGNIIGDAAEFDFIVRNLLSNAIKYSIEGGEVKIAARDDQAGGRRLFIVSDKGIGIPKATQEQLFKTLGNSAPGTAGEQGTGLGLMLCGEFAIANRGKIWVESEPGKGATFYFTFPAS